MIEHIADHHLNTFGIRNIGCYRECIDFSFLQFISHLMRKIAVQVYYRYLCTRLTQCRRKRFTNALARSGDEGYSAIQTETFQNRLTHFVKKLGVEFQPWRIASVGSNQSAADVRGDDLLNGEL